MSGYAICCSRGYREVRQREQGLDVPRTTSLCCLCDTIYCPDCADQHEHPSRHDPAVCGWDGMGTCPECGLDLCMEFPEQTDEYGQRRRPESPE
ncbi:MAG: hypothetical protein ACQGVC_24780 [Myxococcota bacterium]